MSDRPQDVEQALQTIAESVTGQSTAAVEFQYSGVAQVHHVEDGDTLYASYRADPAIIIGKPASATAPDGVDDPGVWLRLVNVDTHETDAEDDQTRQQAREEKQFVQTFVEQGREQSPHEWPFLVAYQGDEFEGAFGRQLTDLIRRSDGRSLTAALLDEFEDIRYQS
jgi:hypothetical protein